MFLLGKIKDFKLIEALLVGVLGNGHAHREIYTQTLAPIFIRIQIHSYKITTSKLSLKFTAHASLSLHTHTHTQLSLSLMNMNSLKFPKLTLIDTYTKAKPNSTSNSSTTNPPKNAAKSPLAWNPS